MLPQHLHVRQDGPLEGTWHWLCSTVKTEMVLNMVAGQSSL